MKQETLERLLIDAALDELSPDVHDLLQAYLKISGVAQPGPVSADETVNLARRVLLDRADADRGSRAAPAFPMAAATKARRRSAAVKTCMRMGTLAACLVIGMLTGVWWRGGGGETPPSVLAAAPLGGAAIDQAFAARTSVAAQHPSHGLWSYERLFERASNRGITTRRQIFWDSPAARPRTGDET